MLNELTFERKKSRPWFYFDADYYLSQCLLKGVTPQIGSAESYLDHYLNKGAREGLSPNPFFDEGYYRQKYPAIVLAIKNNAWSCGFDHYVNGGAAKNFDPAWFFDSVFYEASNRDLTDDNLKRGDFSDRYAHYLRVGVTEARPPHWTVKVLDKFKDEFAFPRSAEALKDFLLDGARVTAAFKPLFDYEWMKEKYGWEKNVQSKDFVRHYLLNVKTAQLSPSAYFDEVYYLAALPEVQKAVDAGDFSCGFHHFVLHGMAEGRRPFRQFDPHYYYETHLAHRRGMVDEIAPLAAFIHFLRNRAIERLSTSPSLAKSDIAEEAGKGIYERRCALNAPMLGRAILPQTETPDVSVIIVAQNNFEQTANCILSVLANTNVSVEIIVFDNASSDKTKDLPSINPQIRYLRAERNLGFTIAVNHAARIARGRVLLLLNNDTEIGPQAVDFALARLEAEHGVGAVGAKIVRMHGRLQEAGSIVWEDGGCLGYGRDASPADGQVNFARDVDFCSGCFLAIPRSVWEELGGFDEAFAPAYYEETDFCLRLWERGLRVVYDPRILLWHFEFGSSLNQEEALALMRRNQRYFASKHRDFLAKCFAENSAYVERARLRHKSGPKILFIEDHVPDPTKGMGFVRSATVARALAEDFGLVSIFGLHDHKWPDADPLRLEGLSAEILTNFNVNNVGNLLNSRAGLYDVVWLSRTHNLGRLQEWRKACPAFFAQTKIVLDTEAVSALRRFAYARQTGQPARLQDLVVEELAALRGVDHICAVSELDVRLLSEALSEMGLSIPVSILGHSLEVQPKPPRFEDTNEIVLFGAYSQPDSPNVDAVFWFDSEIRPLLQDIEGLTFTIAGSEAASFELTGRLENEYRIVNNPPRLGEVFAKARLMVAPTRFAAGIPMKVHDTAAYGVPVVMTELLADQLGWRHLGPEAVASTPKGMADAIRALVTDADAWQRMQAAQRELVARDCNPERWRESLRNVVGGLLK